MRWNPENERNERRCEGRMARDGEGQITGARESERSGRRWLSWMALHSAGEKGGGYFKYLYAYMNQRQRLYWVS